MNKNKSNLFGLLFLLKNFDNTLHAVVSFGAVVKIMPLFFCHDLERTNGNKIAVDVATIAVCANCVERLMPLIFATRQTKRNVRRNYTCQMCFCGKCKT